MELKSETINFLTFVIVGIVLGIVFDFFRAMRKIKKYSTRVVYLQDIIFFIITGLIISSVLIYKLQYDLRIYLFFAIILGVIIYIVTFSRHVVRVLISLIRTSKTIFLFMLLPLQLLNNVWNSLNYKIFRDIKRYLSKIKEKCCNKFFNMVSYNYSMKSSFLKKFNFKRGYKWKTKNLLRREIIIKK